ncbi:hypothetical protein HID58_056820 [Brassica napus]|uniref:Terpene synthase metal-binding domain-containing protein n=1 Tax=Brassica napus TaxID=3708 RepID=A0ABQ8APD3_BRANA|nr:hypothetical protein HID58_056820 [Brassica napus]
MEVGEEEIVACLTLEGIFMSMGKTATKEAYEWRKSRPKLVKALCIKGRVRNDITGYEVQMRYVTNAINCYMKQYGFPLKEAIRELNKIVADADKTLNEEFLKTVAVGLMDFGRMIATTYNVDERFIHPEGKIKEYMTSMLLDQIRL